MFSKLHSLPQIIYIKESDDDWFNEKTNTIYWNPELGILTNTASYLSPATLLNHEADHCLRYNSDPKGMLKDAETIDDQYRNKEEKRVITGSEQDTAEKLGEVEKGLSYTNFYF